MTIFKTIYSSPIGDLSLVADAVGLIGVWFVGQHYFEKGLIEEPVFTRTAILDQTCDWLDRYFDGEAVNGLDVPLSISGSPFQRAVWAELQTIPYGQTVTYKELANRLHCGSAQAIGGAVGKNPLSIVVPCHRVVGTTGHLTGYAGGLERKRWLLKHEQALIGT